MRLTPFPLAAAAVILPLTAAVSQALVDRAGAAGISEVTRTFSATVGDVNGDGCKDLVVVRHAVNPPRLWRNTCAGTFVQIPTPLVRKDRHHCVFLDANDDGRQDLYCTIGAGLGTKIKANDLILQQANGTFLERAVAYGVEDKNGRGRYAAALDANGDGRDDLYVGNAASPDTDSSNRLFLNDGGTRFVSGAAFGATVEWGNQCSEAADFNGDGLDDLLACSRKRGVQLYRNKANTSFEEVGRSLGLPGGNWTDGEFADIDGDGWLDVVLSNATQVVVYEQTATGSFSKGWSSAVAAIRAAMGDADGDGETDIFVVQTGTKPDLLFLNNGNGASFTMLTVPHPGGSGNDVAAIDYDGDGDDEFVVLNGQASSAGPVQLLDLQ